MTLCRLRRGRDYSTHLLLARKNVLLVIEMGPDRRSFSWYTYCNKLDIIKLNTRSLSRFKSSTNNTRSYPSATTLAKDKAEKTYLFSSFLMKRRLALLHLLLLLVPLLRL
jgi:hypothetical protein